MTLFYQDVATKTSSSSQMGRFETGVDGERCQPGDPRRSVARLIDRIHDRKPPRGIIFDMDSFESPTHGEQEGSAWNGFGCTCYQPLFVFNQYGDLERRRLRPGNVQAQTTGAWF